MTYCSTSVSSTIAMFLSGIAMDAYTACQKQSLRYGGKIGYQCVCVLFVRRSREKACLDLVLPPETTAYTLMYDLPVHALARFRAVENPLAAGAGIELLHVAKTSNAQVSSQGQHWSSRY